MRYARQILAVLVTLGIIVLLFVLIARGFRANNSQATVKETSLVSYAGTDSVAQLYIDAPIVLDQDHRTVKISVSREQTEVEIIQGYEGTVVQQEVFPNNTAAYAVFLQALNHLNFAKGNTDPAQADERGYCPAGNRYIYQFVNGDKTLLRYWSTSCGQGTFGGDRPAVRDLFRQQIPPKIFDQLTRSIPLG
jgi:hypothetical protein